MIFGFIGDIVDSTKILVDDATDIGTSVLTFGENGDISKENVSRIVAAGVSLYALSEATGIALDVLEQILEN